jgi:hypothetical protein
VRTRSVLAGAIVVLLLIARGSPNALASPGSRSPQQATVEQFYVELEAGDYADAYALLAPVYQASHPYSSWVAGYATTLGFDWSTRPTDDPRVVAVRIAAQDSVAGWQYFSGSWRLVPRSNAAGWRLAEASIAAAGPRVLPSGQPDFSAFAGGWGRHGFGLGVNADGTATISFRVYQWCSDDPTPPCDVQLANAIYDGGHATLIFTSINGDTAYGSFDDGGSVSLTLLPYDMALLTDLTSGDQTELCGPEFGDLAPSSLVQSSPCGA